MSWTSCHVPDASPPHSHSTSNSLRGIPPPSPTLLAGSARLNADSSAFVPRPRSRIVVKNVEGLEVDLSAIAKSSPISVAGASLDPASEFRQGSLNAVAIPSQRPLSIRIETEKQRRKRLADQKKKFKAKSRAEEEEKERQQEQEQKRNEECKAREEQETSRIIISPLLDITSNTKKASPSFPSACASARVIDDLGSVPYPEGISSPKVELNINAKNGKFR
jgi:translation initiation factor 4G